MIKKLNIKYLVCSFLLSITSSLTSCKDSFLDVKPSTDIVSPKTLEDYQQMLDFFRINYTSALPLLASDEYEIPNEKDWLTLSLIERNGYVWAKNLYEGQNNVEDWNFPYESVFYANSVITGLKDIDRNHHNGNKYDHILGQAYFVRAFAFFDLAKNFAPPYDQASSSKDVGIPLKLNPNVDERVPRATVEETYAQIFSDLQMATKLLFSEITNNRNRANKPAAYALGARISLSMRNYPLAEKYADSCLQLYDKLIDYNDLDERVVAPFLKDNDENILNANVGKNYQSILYSTPKNVSIVKALLDLYDINDLRKTLFFSINSENSLIKMKRGYSGSNMSPYSGLAMDEVYLIKAECTARRNDLELTLKFLDALLIKRFRKGTYVSKKFINSSQALDEVLKERRKELVWRAGLRWDDLRRLNKDGAAIHLHRAIGSQLFDLPPNSPKYVFPIPFNELNGSNITQNVR